MSMRVCYLDVHEAGPSDTYRKPITSIKTVLLPFVTYLLNLLGGNDDSKELAASVFTPLSFVYPKAACNRFFRNAGVYLPKYEALDHTI
jgi:hypothetical protein